MSSKPSIEARVRFLAAMRVKVHITNRRRSQTGFIVEHPKDQRGAVQTPARSKREALAILLAKVRTTETLKFSVRCK